MDKEIKKIRITVGICGPVGRRVGGKEVKTLGIECRQQGSATRIRGSGTPLLVLGI